MVLHFSGFAYSTGTLDKQEFDFRLIPTWHLQSIYGCHCQSGEPQGFIQLIQPDKSKAESQRGRLQPVQDDPPAAQLDGTIVTLQGQLMEATYGFASQNIGILPEGFRPQREIRCLAPLLRRSTEKVGRMS